MKGDFPVHQLAMLYAKNPNTSPQSWHRQSEGCVV